METNKTIINYCGKCLFQSEYRDMGASCYCCSLPNTLVESIIMCSYYAGNCPYFLPNSLLDDLKSDTISRFNNDNMQHILETIVFEKHTRK